MTTGEDLVVAVFDALDALHVPFMLSGSLASNFYGVPRATQDADLVLELEGLPIQALAEQLRDTFVVDAQLAFETVTGSRRVLARARHAPFDVELFGLTDDPHDRERFARRQFVEVLGRRVGMPTAEDVIINKLRWWQREHRRKDFEDARNVLAVQQGVLDERHLARWCAELDLTELLEDARPR